MPFDAVLASLLGQLTEQRQRTRGLQALNVRDAPEWVHEKYVELIRESRKAEQRLREAVGLRKEAVEKGKTDII